MRSLNAIPAQFLAHAQTFDRGVVPGSSPNRHLESGVDPGNEVDFCDGNKEGKFPKFSRFRGRVGENSGNEVDEMTSEDNISNLH